MRIGISLTSRHQVTDVRAGARVMIERTAAARRSGLDSLFVGDHHSVGAPYYQNVRHLTDDQPKVLGSLARLAEVRSALKDV